MYSKILILLIFIFTQAFSQQVGYRKSWALIIGINEYYSLPRLTGAVKSAKLIREKLVREFGFEPENIIELYDDQATRENILRAFDKLMDPKRVSQDDRVFVYFAGHGVTKDVGGKEKGYIMPVDGVMDKFASTAISTDQLHEFQEIIPAKHLFYAMDACYSGMIFTRGIGLKQETFTSKPEAISKFTIKKVRVAITAGRRDEQVVDIADQGISVFAFYFLQGLNGEADVNGDGIITSSELADYVAKNVKFRAPQNPQYGRLPGDEDGEFVFIKTQVAGPVQPQISKPLEQKPKPVPGRIIEREPKGKEREAERKTIITPTGFNRFWVYAFIGGNVNFHSIKKLGELNIEKSEGSGGNLGIGFQYFVRKNLTLGINLLVVDEKHVNWKIKPFAVYDSDREVWIEFGPDVNRDVKLSYFVVNPMLKLYSKNFYFEIGSAVGFLSDRVYKQKAGYRVLDESFNFLYGGTVESSDKIENTRSIRFSLPIGIGYDLRLGRFAIFVEGKYDIGLTNVTKDDDWKISSFQLSLGARLGF